MNAIEILAGLEAILLKPLKSDDGYSANPNQMIKIETFENGLAKFSAECSCQWKPQQKVTVAIEALKDAELFLVLVDQEIDGYSFSATVPDAPGFYWFYGATNPRNASARLLLVEHKINSANRTFWFGGDVRFYNRDFGMIGLWAPAHRPRVAVELDI